MATVAPFAQAPYPDVPSNSPAQIQANVRELPMTGGWSDSQALTVAMGDFRQAETFRQQNHEWRWQNSDETYLAWTKKRTWEGTRIPRSSLPIYLAYQQIEALIPQVIDAFFGGDIDFDVEPGAVGTTYTMCLQVRNLLEYQMQTLDGERPKFNTLREILRRILKSMTIYGNGLAEFGWINAMQAKTQRDRIIGQQMATMMAPNGQPFNVPTGQQTSWIETTQKPHQISQPFLHFRDLRDFYIDPNCPSPNVQESSFCATRQLLTIEHLQGYRGKEGFTIPSDSDLLELAHQKSTTTGDQTKSMTESYRGGYWQPSIDQSKDPRLARVECIRYWQNDRHVWILGRKQVAMNRDNIYGVLPFLDVAYNDVPGRFYGMSVCDLVEGDQKVSEAIINARLDELNLMLHPPFIRKRGSIFSQSMARWRPGMMLEAEDPKNDFIKMEMPNVTQSAFIEIAAVQDRTQKTVGITDVAGFGAATAGGNSANRTATGVSAQTSAQSTRVHYLVSNIEDQFILQLLNIFMGLNKRFLDPSVLMEILGPNGEPMQVDPLNVLNADPRFKMKTANRMRSRAALQAGGMVAALQYFLNSEVMGMMAEQQGKTLDIDQLSTLFCDTYNLKATSLYRPLTQQEVEAHQQKVMAPLQAQQQLQDSRLQAISQQKSEHDETELIKTVIAKLGETGYLHKLLGMAAPSEPGQ